MRTRTISRFPHLRGKIIAIDTEGTGLRPYHGDRIFCWSYFTEKGEYGYLRKTPASLRYLQRLLNNPTKTIVFHNAKYDLTMLMMEGIDIFHLRARIDCTLMLSKVLRSTATAHDLQSVAQKYLRKSDEDKTAIVDWVRRNNTKRLVRERGGQKVGFQDAPDWLVKARALWDAEATLLLYLLLWPKAKATCSNLYETERQLIWVCIDMEREGVRIDITRAQQLREQALADTARIQRDLNTLVLPLTVERMHKGRPISEMISDEFNPNSSQHMVGAFKKLGIKLRFRTKAKKSKGKMEKVGGGNWSFDEYAMIRYVSSPLVQIIRESGEQGWKTPRFYKAVHDAVQKHHLRKAELVPPLVLKYRELTKMISTYYDHLIGDCIDIKISPIGRKTGILHCRFNQAEAVTGRFSSSKPNLQNIPRLLGPRECFIPRKGHRNWYLDYEQVEMRFFVHFAHDRKMAKALESDIHLHVAAELYRIPTKQVSGEQRKRAKGTNFGIIYGISPPTQAEALTKKGLPTTLLEATVQIANYHSAFPSIRKLINDLRVQLGRRGFIVNPFGRQYHLSSSVAYKALNYLCQGTSADQMKAAMVAIWKWLQSHRMKSKLIKTVHDELVLQCPRNEEAEVIPVAMEIMSDLDSYFVPITVSAKVVDRRWSAPKSPKELGFQFA